MVKTFFSETDKFELQQRRQEDKEKRQKGKLNQSRFAESRTARAGNFFGNLAKARQQQLAFASALKGRPKGRYKKGYAAYGGVYGYRKQLAFQRRLALLQAQRNAQLSPEEQLILQQAQQRRRAQLLAKENQTIPDTDGRFDLSPFDAEIARYSNLV